MVEWVSINMDDLKETNVKEFKTLNVDRALLGQTHINDLNVSSDDNCNSRDGPIICGDRCRFKMPSYKCMLYSNIAFFLTSLLLFLIAVPHISSHVFLRQDLATREGLHRICENDVAANRLEILKLNENILSCNRSSNDLEIQLNDTKSELEAKIQQNKWLDDQISNYKQTVAELTVRLQLKDHTISMLQGTMSQKTSEPGLIISQNRQIRSSGSVKSPAFIFVLCSILTFLIM